MSQEYTEDKELIFRKLGSGQRLLGTVLIIMSVLAGWLMVALVSFDPSDQSWSQTAWHEPIYNLGGSLGAWIADALFFILGVLAYAVPPIIVALCFVVFHLRHSDKYNDCFSLSLRLIGSLALLFSSCGLAALNIDDIYYFASGGVIGGLISHAMLSWFQDIGATLTMLCIWVAGFTLFTGWSWLIVAEKIGAMALSIVTFITDRSRNESQHDATNCKIDGMLHQRTDGARQVNISAAHNANVNGMLFNDIQLYDVLFSVSSIDEVLSPVSSIAKTWDITCDNSVMEKAEEENDDDSPLAVAEQLVVAPLQPISEVSVDEHILTATPPIFATDSLIHPFLMRNLQPLQKTSTLMPTLDLLASPPIEAKPIDMFSLEQTARLIETRLADYRIKAKVVAISPGPVITRFELDLAPGVKAARISSLSRDLARSLSAIAVRIVEVIPGKPYVGLELPNDHRQTVYLREVLDCARFQDKTSPLAVVLGKDIAGQPVVADLATMPHLLVAGTTGSGKSVGINAMILSILYKATPEEVRFIMIDPKMLELSVYEGIPHLLTEVVTDMKDAANALRWCVAEMERRYKLMSALGVRNLAGYNERVAQAQAMGRPIPDPYWIPSDNMETTAPVLKKLEYIVVLVDEFADLMMTVGKKVEELIARLAQKARAAGIHLVLATQRPSVDVITGLIKANIPTRIAFTVSSKIDSRTILDQGGAESLLGMGDMLYMAPNSSIPIRIHGAFVRDQEVHAVVNDWKARGRPQYIDGILSGSEEGEGNNTALENDEELDPLFDLAVAFVLEKRRASISGVQRQFRIGYNRAARIVEQMEAQQIVSAQGHNGNREVLAQSPPE